MYEKTYPSKRFNITLDFLKKHIKTSETIFDLGVPNPFSKIMVDNGYSVINTKGEDIMKYLKEVTIIFGITMLGEFLNYLLPFPVPSGVYGLFILLLLLCTGALHTEDVAEVGDFFLDTMPIMFIPAGVGLLDSVQEAESILVPLTVITVISTVFVMVATGCVAQSIIRRKNKGGAKA